MEPLNSVASVSAAGDACEIWCGTQSQTMAVAAAAKALGIPPGKVKLNLMLLGGGVRAFLAMAGSELSTYDIPNRLSEQLPQQTGIRTSSLRGIGFGPNKFATEAFLDEIAVKHRLDPVDLRLQLLKNAPRGQAVVREVVAMSEYRRARPGRGLGFSFIDYAGTMVAA